MSTNWDAMQIAQTMDDGKKERRAPGDVNLKQMAMGSWLANLSKGGQPSRSLKGRVMAEKVKGKK